MKFSGVQNNTALDPAFIIDKKSDMMTEISFLVERSKLIRGPTIMKGPKMGLTGGIINKVRYAPLLTDPKVSHGRHEVTVIITDKRKARECIAEP